MWGQSASPAPAQSPGASAPAASATPNPFDPANRVVLGYRNSQVSSELTAALPKVDARLPWTVCRFISDGLPAQWKYLTLSIPIAIASELGSLPPRDLVPAELDAEAKYYILKIRASMGKKLSEAIQSRDADELLQKAEPAKRPEIKASIENLERVWRQASLLEPSSFIQDTRRSFSGPSDIQKLPEWPFSFTDAKPVAMPDIRAFGDQQKLWFAILGTIGYEGGQVNIHLVVVNTICGTILSDAYRSYPVTDGDRAASELANIAASAMLGYEPSSLTLLTDPGVQTSLNPVALSTAPNSWTMLKPGDYIIHASNPGFVSQDLTVSLKPGQSIQVPIKLEKLDNATIRITSVPSGAQVYEGADWVGTTPFDYPRPEANRLILVRKDKYARETLQLGPLADKQVDIALHPDFFDWDAEVEIRRDRVYDALGVFAVSLVIPIVFEGLFELQLKAKVAAGTNASESYLNDLASRGLTYYYIRNMGVAVSGVLLFNALVQIAGYITAADRLDYKKKLEGY